MIIISFIALIVLSLPIFLQAQGPVVPPNVVILTDEQGEYPLGLHLEFLEDKEKAWTIDDVTSPELTQQFVPSQGNRGRTHVEKNLSEVGISSQDKIPQKLNFIGRMTQSKMGHMYWGKLFIHPM